jgi:nucleoside-diphosphate-sugar epimerase
MKTVLVTGANGVIGSAVTTYLATNGFAVRPVYHRPHSPLNDRDVIIDLSRTSVELENVISPLPETIVHLAAQVVHSNADTQEMADITRAMDENILHFAMRHQLPVLYASGTSLYSDKSDQPKNENGCLDPHGNYLTAKYDGECLFLQYNKSCIMRISGPVGSRKCSGVYKFFLEQALSGKTITLWGKGAREQDFIDVRDIASFVRFAIENNLTGIFNVASGTPITMANLAEAFSSVIDRCTYTFVDRVDPQENYLARFSIRKAENLGWHPKYDIISSIEYTLSNKE